MSDEAIQSLLKETRRFEPPAEFALMARIGSREDYDRLYRESLDEPEAFWQRETKDLVFRTHWTETLHWELPHAKWFQGATLNISESCLDRHLGTARANKAAIVWEGEFGATRTITYAQLHREVCKFANVLESLGLKKGDRAAIYMPMVPEAAVAMLAAGRTADAERRTRAALPVLEAGYGRDHALVANAYIGLGDARLTQGDAVAAARYFEEGRARMARYSGW